MPISKEKLVELKNRLLEDKSRIEDNIRSLANTDFGDAPGLDNEEADEAEELANTTATIDMLKERVQNIDAALKRIEADNYGLCEVDQGEIEVEVLEANPESTTCKKHKD